MSQSIYLDHNATTPMPAPVKDAVLQALEQVGNPSAVHSLGAQAKKNIEHARTIVADFVGADRDEIIFTSGGTESNNMVLAGVPATTHVLVSASEHSAVAKFADVRPNTHLIPMDIGGVIDLVALEKMLSETSGEKLVSVAMASNETGVIQPLSHVIEIARRHGAFIHTDAVQALGKVPINFSQLDVDALSLSAHKVGGMPGCGALILRKSFSLTPLLIGGGQERGKRSGTLNLPGIVSFGAALNIYDATKWEKIRAFRDGLEEMLIQKNAYIYGKVVSRLPNTSCLAMEGVANSTQVMAFDLAGICVSAGSACSSRSMKPSPILHAIDPAHAPFAIRVSMGQDTTINEVQRFQETWLSIFHKNNSQTTQEISAYA